MRTYLDFVAYCSIKTGFVKNGGKSYVNFQQLTLSFVTVLCA